MAVFARNSIASVVQKLDGGRVRTHRSQYAYAPDTVYLQAWRRPRWLRRDPSMLVELHVSELNGLHEWSYVWASGVANLLQPSNDAAANEEWEAAVGHIRRVPRRSGRAADDGLPGYGVVRVDIRTLGGVVLRMR